MTSPVTFWTTPRERALARHAEMRRDEAVLWNRVFQGGLRARVLGSWWWLHSSECLAIAERCERQIRGA